MCAWVCMGACVCVCVCMCMCVCVCTRAHVRAGVHACTCMHLLQCIKILVIFLELKVDVFAFGMTIYELITMKPPYNEFPRKNPANLHKYVRDGRRPSLTDKVINAIRCSFSNSHYSVIVLTSSKSPYRIQCNSN